jgi:hypothetical protein
VLSAFREVQLPLLAVLLIGAAAGKAGPAIRGQRASWSGPTALVPLLLRDRAAIALCIGEFFLGTGLLVTAGSFGAGVPAMVIRSLATLLFVTVVGALHELRSRRPEAGCGCFGDLSQSPVSWRVLTRAGLLALASLSTVTAGPLPWRGNPGPLLPGLTPLAQVWLLLGAVAAEIAVLAALSPEVGEVMVRLGYSEPCELRRIPVARTLGSLRASAHWRRYQRYLSDTEPDDVWREGCWRYAAFPGIAGGRPVDLVFAVHMQPRRPAIRSAIVDAVTNQALTGHTVPFQRANPPASAELYDSLRESQY